MANNIVNSNDMRSIPWTNGTGSDVAAGDIVKLGGNGSATLYVALVDIADGASGSLGYNCSVTAPKVSAAVFGQGEALGWDHSSLAFDDNALAAAAGDVKGPCARSEVAGANTETTCTVFLTGIPGTLS